MTERPPSLAARLRAAGCVYAEDEAALLLAEAPDGASLEQMVEQRIAGLPLEQVLGWAEFCGLRVAVRLGVFVPRRRTEFLARRAVELAGRRARAVVLDLCCGSGAIGAAVAARVPSARLYAADIDPVAVACARVNLGERGHVVEGDLFEPVPVDLRGGIDVLVANAPYVPTGELGWMPPEARLHEPESTLDGGPDGLDLHRRIADTALDWLAPQGRLLAECSERQAPILVKIYAERGLVAEVVRDDEADATLVIGAPPGGFEARFAPTSTTEPSGG